MQQAEFKTERKRKQEVFLLVSKIRRLKNKLYTYGMSSKQAIQAILYQFLKAPQIDWSLLHNTSTFYQIQNKYHTDHNTAQLILILSALIPNWQTRTVLDYLHETLTYNALSFGIELQISDDSSNEDNGDMTFMLIKAKKKNRQFALKPKKRFYHSTGAIDSSYNDLMKKQASSQDEQLVKKVHTNQKIQNYHSAARKTTEDNLQQQNIGFNQANYWPHSHDQKKNKDNQRSEEKIRKQIDNEKEDHVKRRQPIETQILEEEKLDKKVKK